MSIPRRLCAETIRDFARYVGECGDDVARARLLEAAESYIAGRDMPPGKRVPLSQEAWDARKPISVVARLNADWERPDVPAKARIARARRSRGARHAGEARQGGKAHPRPAHGHTDT